MKKKTFLFSAVAIFLILGSSAQAYRQVIDLGGLSTYRRSASYINNNGQIVGGAYNSSFYKRACLFDPTGSGANIDLGTLGGNLSWAYSINDNGQIVGQGSIASAGRACLFDPTGGGANKNLGTLDSYPHSEAASINNNGQIVGHVYGLKSGYNDCGRACLFDPTGGGANINLGTLGGKYMSVATSINNNGQIVGGAHNSSGYYACLFDPTGGGANISLGALSSTFNRSIAYSINNNGDIVGLAYNSSSSSNCHACLFDPTGGEANIDLGTLGTGYSEAKSINDKGQIVGWASGRACLFDPTGNGNNIDLNTLIDPSSGWLLYYATSINNNGWIVGYGYKPVGGDSGPQHAFLLTPEPTTVLLLGLGAVMLRRKK